MQLGPQPRTGYLLHAGSWPVGQAMSLQYRLLGLPPSIARSPRRVYTPGHTEEKKAAATPIRNPQHALSANQKAAVIDGIADLMAEAVMADFIENSDGFGRFPVEDEPCKVRSE